MSRIYLRMDTTSTRTTKLTSRTAVMLILTLSSCFFRESLSLIHGRVSNPVNGIVRRNDLYRPAAVGANVRTIYSKDNNRPRNRSFFQNHKSGDRIRLSVSAYHKGIIVGARNSNIHNDESGNQNRYRISRSIHRRYHINKNIGT